MMCFNKKFYLFFLKHLFHPISDRFGPYFGPFRSEFDRIGPRSENGKKKKKSSRAHVQPRPQPHDVSVRIELKCLDPIDALVLSRFDYPGICLSL